MTSEGGAAKLIVEAATEILLTSGLDGFSARAVSKATALSLGTITHHFPRMENLIDVVLERIHLETTAAIGEGLSAIARGGAIGDVAASTTIALYRRLKPLRPLVQLRLSENHRRGTMSQRNIERHVYPLLDRVIDELGAGFSAARVRLAMQSLSVLVMRYVLHPDNEKIELTDLRAPEFDAADRERAIEEHLALVATALFAKPATR